ncbi:hypothetical protein ACJX0J_010044, partial [Zea mays]
FWLLIFLIYIFQLINWEKEMRTQQSLILVLYPYLVNFDRACNFSLLRLFIWLGAMITCQCSFFLWYLSATIQDNRFSFL